MFRIYADAFIDDESFTIPKNHVGNEKDKKIRGFIFYREKSGKIMPEVWELEMVGV